MTIERRLNGLYVVQCCCGKQFINQCMSLVGEGEDQKMRFRGCCPVCQDVSLSSSEENVTIVKILTTEEDRKLLNSKDVSLAMNLDPKLTKDSFRNFLKNGKNGNKKRM